MPRESGSLAVASVCAAALSLSLAACSGSSTAVNASLSGLAVSAGSLNPAFASGTTEYSDVLPSGTLTVTVTPTASDSNAKSITVAQDSGTPVTVASGQASPALTVPARGARSVITIVVTGSDSKTTGTYTVALVQADNGDATLSALSLSAGTLNPAFASGTTAYNVTVPNGTASFKVTPTADYANVASITVAQDTGAPKTVTSGSASGALTVPPAGGQSTITITVTAQNGYTTLAYVITLVQAGNSDASLASLKASVGALTPAFASATTSYSLVVPSGTASVKLTPTANNASVRSIQLTQDGGAAVTIASGSASAALPVPALGSTSAIAITIESQDGTTTETYNISLAQVADSDATLASLAISAGTLAPAFASATTSYSAIVPSGTSSVTVTPTAHDTKASSITVSQDGGTAVTVASGAASSALAVPAVGTTSTITVTVTAQDESATDAYTIALTQAASTDSSLALLTVNAGTLRPAFSSATTSYSLTVPSNNAGFTLTPTAHSALAKSITIAQDGGAAVAIASGAASASYTIPATGTSTVFAIVVTAQSNAATTYQVTVNRAATNDATLASIDLSAGTLSPSFVPLTTSYTAVIPYGTSTIALTPEADSPNASSVTVAQDSGTPVNISGGSPSATLAVPAVGGSSTVTITVTAQDGVTTQTYIVVLSQHAPNTDALLSSLTSSVGTLTPAFASGTNAYTLSVSFGTASFTLTPTADDANAFLITVQQDAGTPAAVASGMASAALTIPVFGGTSTISVVVTAQDQSTQATYMVSVSQAGRNDSTLSALVDSAGALTGFTPGTTTYSYTVPNQAGPYTITATTNDSLATLQINGSPAMSGVAFPVTLTTGSNTITIAVTSADGTSTADYVLTVTETAPLPGLINARTVPVTAGVLLQASSGAYLPANDATGVPIDTLLRIGFDSPPAIGATGSIKIFNSTTQALVDTINIADPYAIYSGSTKTITTNATSTKVNIIGNIAGAGVSQVRVVNYVPIIISGTTAIIVPHNNKLAYNTSYYVTIDSGVLVGTVSGGTNFGGIVSQGYWGFTTKASGPTAGFTSLQVADDNSGDFATVQGAIDAVSPGSTAITINIAPGVYQEMLFIRGKNNLTFKGSDNGLTTIIQYDNCDGFNPGTGGGQAVSAGAITTPTSVAGGGRSVLLTSSASGLVLDSITLFNLHPFGSDVLATIPTPYTAIPNSSSTTPGATFVSYSSSITQAETIYFNVSYSSTKNATTGSWVDSVGTLVAKHSNFISYQDTVQVKGVSWFYDSFITGDVDFIWGNANTALFENCEIKSRADNGGSSIVQPRAYLGVGTSATPPTASTTAYPGFVFLNCALTKEDGSFTAYLARSDGAVLAATSEKDSNNNQYYEYNAYDLVSFINCSMDTHINAIGWNPTPSSSSGGYTGADIGPDPVTGWKEYGSITPAGAPIDVSNRLGSGANPITGAGNGSGQLTAADIATFYPNRATIFAGTTGSPDGTSCTTNAIPNFSPVP